MTICKTCRGPLTQGTGGLWLHDNSTSFYAGRQMDHEPEPGAGGLNFDQLVVACKNIGIDLSCGACAALFFTGYGGYTHAPGCLQATKQTSRRRLP